MSTVLFLAEIYSMLRFRAFRSKWQFRAMVLLHLGCEDAYQTVIYTMVAASQASSGLGLTSSGALSIFQAIFMLGLKVMEMSGALQVLIKRFRKKAKEGHAAGDSLEPATIGARM